MTRVDVVRRALWPGRLAAVVLLLILAAAAAGVGSGRADAHRESVVVARLHTASVTAPAFGPSDCGDFPPGSPGPGRDGWVFQASPGGGWFRSMRLDFAGPDGLTTAIELSSAADGVSSWGSRLFNNGTQWWLSTPSGWTLRTGTAGVSGSSGDHFEVIRTCWGQRELTAHANGAVVVPRAAAAAGGGSAGQQVRVVIAPTGSAGRPTDPPASTVRPSPPPAVAGPAAPVGWLPTTGGPIALLVAASVGLIVLGGVLRLVRRKGD